jgi:hypothetical protein
MSNFTVDYNGLSLGPSTDYSINNAIGLNGLPIRTSESLNTGADGGNIWEQHYDMRSIAFTGKVSAGTVSDYMNAKDDLVSAFSINDSNTLTVQNWNGDSYTITAKVIRSPEIPYDNGQVTMNDYRVELKAEDPFWKGSTAVTGSASLSDEGGTPVSSPVPSPVGTASDNLVSITNNGDVEYYPSITINGSVENPTVTNTTTGESFSFDYDLEAGGSIEVYYQTGEVFAKKGSADIYENLTGDLFKLATGTNSIRFTADTFSSSASIDITFYPRYLTA